MKQILKISGIIILVALVLWAIIGWEVYKYKECKKVGHSTFYCVMTFGSK